MENLLPDELHHNDKKIDPQNDNYVAVVNKRQRLINEHYKEQYINKNILNIKVLLHWKRTVMHSFTCIFLH